MPGHFSAFGFSPRRANACSTLVEDLPLGVEDVAGFVQEEVVGFSHRHGVRLLLSWLVVISVYSSNRIAYPWPWRIFVAYSRVAGRRRP